MTPPQSGTDIAFVGGTIRYLMVLETAVETLVAR